MQIQTIKANNFKSLVDFELDLAKFTCLIGLNGAGKSTVLQFIDFLSRQVHGDIAGWLSERNWAAKELKSQLTRKKHIDFSVSLDDASFGGGYWQATFNPTSMHCPSESIVTSNVRLEVHGDRFSISRTNANDDAAIVLLNQPISFRYQGSILSQLIESTLPAPLLEFKQFFENVKSLDLLSPESLRQRTRESAGTLGLGGQKLSAFLHELGPKKRLQLVKRLKAVYPKLESIDTTSLRSGWKQLRISEAYPGEESGFLPAMSTEARHVADGMLRVMAILAEIQTEHRFLLFDEIENGINPELVEFLVDALVTAPQQVLVTTHSPMILNYLDDETAVRGVMYVYKTERGYTQATPFFSIPSIVEKLTVMGPGEAFADTHLAALQDEIEAVAQGQ